MATSLYKDERTTRSALRLEVVNANAILNIAHKQKEPSASVVAVAGKHLQSMMNHLVSVNACL